MASDGPAGAYHGINPGMGWLFAVALGMQQGRARGYGVRRRDRARSRGGVGVVLVTVWLAQIVVPLAALKVLVAVMLMTLGLYRLWRHRHPRFGGMQVGFRDLTVWSFLMASAHGAGLMVLPFVMPTPTLSAATNEHVHDMPVASSNMAAADAMAVAIHTLAYLAVMALIAWVVHRKLGLSCSAWPGSTWTGHGPQHWSSPAWSCW